jgi:hypothetical protein
MCLCAGDFLQLLHQKLCDGSLEEKRTVACVVWALVANNQKGKLLIRCSGIDAKLQQSLNQLRLLPGSEDTEIVEGIHIINSVLRIVHGDNGATRRRWQHSALSHWLSSCFATSALLVMQPASFFPFVWYLSWPVVLICIICLNQWGWVSSRWQQ